MNIGFWSLNLNARRLMEVPLDPGKNLKVRLKPILYIPV